MGSWGGQEEIHIKLYKSKNLLRHLSLTMCFCVSKYSNILRLNVTFIFFNLFIGQSSGHG